MMKKRTWREWYEWHKPTPNDWNDWSLFILVLSPIPLSFLVALLEAVYKTVFR